MYTKKLNIAQLNIFSINDKDKIPQEHIEKKIGKGTHGTVFDLGKDYAGKIFEDIIEYSTIREISILSYLNHPNIIKIIGNGIVKGKLMLIMEKAKSDISSILRIIEPIHRPLIIFQILNALSFMHNNNIAHRDIKPQNILLFNDIDIKLCDFGLSKLGFLSNTTHTSEVVTLWYRAPEVILNPENYDMSIDIWSVGIILLEMILKDKFPMNENGEIITLFKIFKLIGTPDEKTWSGLSKMKNWKDTFPKFKGNLDDLLYTSNISNDEKDLLKKMITYPLNRISAGDALNHPYFSELKKKYPILNTYCINNVNVNKTLSTSLNPIKNKEILYKRIVVLFSWFFDIRQDYNLNYSTIFTAFNIFNEYIKCNKIKKKNLQLVGIACMDIACKLLEVKMPEIKDWCLLCSNCYTDISIQQIIYDLLLYFKFNILPMIIYNNELIYNKHEIFLKIICCFMKNNILKILTFEEIINKSKMIINNVMTPEIKFIFYCIKSQNCSIPQCNLVTDVLSYINEIDGFNDINKVNVNEVNVNEVNVNEVNVNKVNVNEVNVNEVNVNDISNKQVEIN
jgi:serine/threonine protein kinase